MTRMPFLRMPACGMSVAVVVLVTVEWEKQERSEGAAQPAPHVQSTSNLAANDQKTSNMASRTQSAVWVKDSGYGAETPLNMTSFYDSTSNMTVDAPNLIDFAMCGLGDTGNSTATTNTLEAKGRQDMRSEIE